MKIQFFFQILNQNTVNTYIVNCGLSSRYITQGFTKSPFLSQQMILSRVRFKTWTVTIPKVILGTENKGKISYILRTWRAPAPGNNGTIINYHKFYIVPLYHSPFYHSDYFSRLMASLRTVSLDESSNVLSRVTILGTGFVIRRYLPQANLC